MTYEQFNQFCGQFHAATYVIQWGGAHVWKVGGKVWAIGGWADNVAAYTFKTTDIAFEILKDQPGMRPAPYLGSRGFKWIQRYAASGISDQELQEYLQYSYEMVSHTISKKKRIALGLPLDPSET